MFDPFEPELLKQAFKSAIPVERAGLLRDALKEMAEGLRGISAVISLVDLDADNFLAGLKLAIKHNPRNLTASRALIWFYLRQNNKADAERCYVQIEAYWPKYDELIFEHLRLLILTGDQKKQAFFEENKRFFKNPVSLVSYGLQTGVSEVPNANDLNNVELMQLGRNAFFEMLNPSSTKMQGFPAEQANGPLWKFCEIVSNASSIALVGNGPRLKGSGLGAEISAHDIVIRCNFAEIDDFIKDVGSRTDLVVFNETLRTRIPKLRGRSSQYREVPALGLHPEAKFGLSTGEFVSYPFTSSLPPVTRNFISRLCYSRSTTGLMALNLLLVVYQKKVSMYGFDFFGDVSRPHYFGNQTGAYLGHELEYERWYCQNFIPSILPDHVKYC